jgi:hypothetical protein
VEDTERKDMQMEDHTERNAAVNKACSALKIMLK